MEGPKLSCKLNILSRPDGSVLYCEGETAVIAGIYGPVEARTQKLLTDKAGVECNYRPKAGLPGIKDRFHESIIRNVCEKAMFSSLYPRAAILMNVQELHDNGNLISCSINASCLACLHSGIDMKSVFAAVTCFLTVDEELALNVSVDKNSIKATAVFVFENIQKKVIASHTQGTFTIDQYKKGLELARLRSELIFDFFKSTIENTAK